MGVSAFAQGLFDGLNKTMECVWDSDQIRVVKFNVLIRPPYGDADVGIVEGADPSAPATKSAYERVKLVVRCEKGLSKPGFIASVVCAFLTANSFASTLVSNASDSCRKSLCRPKRFERSLPQRRLAVLALLPKPCHECTASLTYRIVAL